MKTIKDGMKIINNQKGRFAIWQMDDYKIINLEPTDKYGSWVVVKDDKIIYVETHLTKAKRHIRWLGIFGHDENLIVVNENESLYRKLELRLKNDHLMQLHATDMQEFFRQVPRIKGLD